MHVSLGNAATNACASGSYSTLSQDFKMPVQNSNSKITAHPDLANHLLQVFIPKFYILKPTVSKKAIYTAAMSIFVFYPQKSQN